MNRFVDVLKQLRLDGTFSQMLSRLDKNDLIVLDDVHITHLVPVPVTATSGTTKVSRMVPSEYTFAKR